MTAPFYDAVLGVLGFERLAKPPEKPLAYVRDPDGNKLQAVCYG